MAQLTGTSHNVSMDDSIISTTEVACAGSVKSSNTHKMVNRVARALEGGKKDDIVEEEDEDDGSQLAQQRNEEDMASVQIEDCDEMASDESSETSIKRMEGSFTQLNNDERRKSRGSLTISR